MTNVRVLMVGVAVLACAGSAAGRGPASPAGRSYDPHTVETVRGEVTSVETLPAASGRSGGVHVTLKTDRETIAVHLGPAWWVEKQKPRIAKGDTVEVEGSRVTYEGKPAVIAREVKKGGETLTLRNAAGVPVWAGRGRRR